MTTTKEYLQKYMAAMREAQDIEQRITTLRLKYSSPGAIQYSDMPKSHNSNHDLSDYVSQLDKLYDTLIAKYHCCVNIESDILDRLDRMQKQEEREMLRYRYVDGLTWEQIAERMDYTLRHVYRVHGSALQHFPMPEE